MDCRDCPEYKPGIITEKCCVCENMSLRMQMAFDPVQQIRREFVG